VIYIRADYDVKEELFSESSKRRSVAAVFGTLLPMAQCELRMPPSGSKTAQNHRVDQHASKTWCMDGVTKLEHGTEFHSPRAQEDGVEFKRVL
jgi:hypothetical protein